MVDGLICPVDGIGTIRLIPEMPHAWLAEPGQILAGKYRILEEIGHGGHGVVYRAEHLFGLGTVALKLLRSADPDVQEMRRFFREAQVTARLRGPHTARVYDVGQTEFGSLYLAMELVDGLTLETRLRQLKQRGQVLSEAEATRIGAGVLAGLQETHAHRLVHRDLKPSNIALGNQGRDVKILDFGLAQVMGSSLTPMSRAPGTPHYMSPEQCSGQPVDHRSDLYALGIVLYRCVTGALPFRDPNALTTMWAQIHAPVPDLASAAPQPVSPQFVAVVLRALSKEPARRFASAGEMRAALLGEEHVALEPGGLFQLAAPRPAAKPAPERGDPATSSATALTVPSPAAKSSASLAFRAMPGRWFATAALVAAAATLAAVWTAQKPAAGTAPAARPTAAALRSALVDAAPLPTAPRDPPMIQTVPDLPPPAVPTSAALHTVATQQVAKVPPTTSTTKKRDAGNGVRKRAADWKLQYLPQ